MPNTKYNRGRAAEYAAIAWLKAKGWKYAQRSAGSHGVSDVFAYGHASMPPVLCQVKSGRAYMTEVEKAALRQIAAADGMLSGYWHGRMEWL